MVSDVPTSEQTSERSEGSEQGSEWSECSEAEHGGVNERPERCGVNERANEWPFLNDAVFSILDHSEKHKIQNPPKKRKKKKV